MTNQEIRALRKTLKETRRVFARRFGVSYRTVESWEQGVHVPHPTVRQALEALQQKISIEPDIDDSGGQPRYCEMCDVWMTETECPACGAEAVRAAK